MPSRLVLEGQRWGARGRGRARLSDQTPNTFLAITLSHVELYTVLYEYSYTDRTTAAFTVHTLPSAAGITASWPFALPQHAWDRRVSCATFAGCTPLVRWEESRAPSAHTAVRRGESHASWSFRNISMARWAIYPRGREGHPQGGGPWYCVVHASKIMYRVHMVHSMHDSEQFRL